jgi:hypothetical protein
MSSYADLALYNRNGQLTAIAEVKNKLGTSREWATQLRRNILAHSGHYNADFFLLVTPDRLYLWKNADTTPTLIEPHYEINAEAIFVPYFSRAGVDPHNVSGHAFELVVAAWLSDLVRAEGLPEQAANGQKWLVESGFLTAVRDGRLAYEVTV